MAIEATLQADAAQLNTQRAMNRIDMVERRLENRIADLDKYVVADQKTVTFDFDSSALTKEAISRLDDIAGQVAQTPTGYLIELQGFTDGVGAEIYNLALSGRRAESVLRYLVSKDVPLYRISVVGLGKAKPVADNNTPEGREQNRRVAVRVLVLPGVSTPIH
jgi:OOP family OmpA-OmpF porin